MIDTHTDTDHTAPVTPADYARAALLRGLALEHGIGMNPYRFGMIGSTDSHSGLCSAEENNFHGKFAVDGIPESKRKSRIGDAELEAFWTDPEFDASQTALDHVRVLEIPTPRHSLYDAVALPEAHVESHAATIQERAYTSPIWFTPSR